MSEQQPTDLVAVLRELSGPRYPDDICGKRAMGEAADEIERLRTQILLLEATGAEAADEIEKLRAECSAARESEACSRATLSAWFNLAKKAEEAGADVLRDAIETWLRTSLNGGMPTKHADIVRTVVNEAARLYLWNALVPVLRTIQDEQRDVARREGIEAALAVCRTAAMATANDHSADGPPAHSAVTLVEREIRALLKETPETPAGEREPQGPRAVECAERTPDAPGAVEGPPQKEDGR